MSGGARLIPLHPVAPRPPVQPEPALALPLRAVRVVGRYACFLWDYVNAARRVPPPAGRTLEESYRIGVQSLPILGVISIFVGTNLAIQGHAAFRQLGGEQMIGYFVAMAGVRELAPILAASMIAAKAGTEMASQIGVMRIREQIDALEVMAVNPYAWLVTPRLLGILLVLPALTVISMFLMVAAGYGVTVWQLDQNGFDYVTFAIQGVRPVDFLYATIKSLVFGVMICTVSCFFGFTCGKGPEGVGMATNRAVVVSAVLCTMVNYLLSEALYGGLG